MEPGDTEGVEGFGGKVRYECSAASGNRTGDFGSIAAGSEESEAQMNSVSPVWTEEEVAAEQVVALGQEQYYPIIVLRATFTDKDGEVDSVASVTRFRFSDAERAAIASGADILISQPHHGQMMPIGLQLAMPDQYPMEVR